MSDTCYQQLQRGSPLVRCLHNQSILDDFVIILTKRCVRPRAKLPIDPEHAGWELFWPGFAGVDSLGRPLLVLSVAIPEWWDQPCSRQDTSIEHIITVDKLVRGRTVAKTLQFLVGNNRPIVGWETVFDVASVRIGVCSR